jgi:hypothetical protein
VEDDHLGAQLRDLEIEIEAPELLSCGEGFVDDRARRKEAT